MKLDLSRIKSSTKAVIVFLLFNASATQITAVRDWVVPQIAAHPKWAGIVVSVAGILLALHRPMAQLALHKLVPDAPPDVPIEPGAKIDDVVVVPKQPE